MNWWPQGTATTFKPLLIFAETLTLVLAMLLLNWALKKKATASPEYRYFRLLILTCTAVLGGLLILLRHSGQSTSVDHIVTLVGILMSAAIALSSTTFISNFMAGVMIARVRHFRAGDFLKVGEHFGRVSEMGLLHTEIQTEDSNLTTFPNLFLVTNPCAVVRKDRTIISATVSLGYDIPHSQVKEVLCSAAERVPLDEPFVRILDLGDFAVTYRISGFLENVKQLLPSRSKLREKMLDALHEAGIEIVSPTFMYTRAQATGEHVMSKAEEEQAKSEEEPHIFDKADEAESIEEYRLRLDALLEEVKSIKVRIKEGVPSNELEQLKRELRWRETSIAFLEKRIEVARD